MVTVDRTNDAEALRQQQERRQRCLDDAIGAGLKSGVVSAVVASGLIAALQSYSTFFRSHFTVGSKAAFAALPAFYSFWWASEKKMASCAGAVTKLRRATAAAVAQQQQRQQQQEQQQESQQQQLQKKN